MHINYGVYNGALGGTKGKSRWDCCHDTRDDTTIGRYMASMVFFCPEVVMDLACRAWKMKAPS